MAFKISGNEIQLTVPADKIFKMQDVMEAILKQVRTEVVMVYVEKPPNLHFARLMSRYELLQDSD